MDGFNIVWLAVSLTVVAQDQYQIISNILLTFKSEHLIKFKILFLADQHLAQFEKLRLMTRLSSKKFYFNKSLLTVRSLY